MQIFSVPFGGSNLDLGHSLEIVFVVEAIAQDVAKVAQGSFQGVGGGFLFSFLESSGLAFAILDVAVANVLHYVSDWKRD